VNPAAPCSSSKPRTPSIPKFSRRPVARALTESRTAASTRSSHERADPGAAAIGVKPRRGTRVPVLRCGEAAPPANG
jgi:hypothetical protein